MLLALAWGLGAQSNGGCTTHSPNRMHRGLQAACWGSQQLLQRQGCPQQGGPAWSPSHHPATFSEDCMVGLGVPQSSSSIVSGEKWMGRGWKLWWASDAAGGYGEGDISVLDARGRTSLLPTTLGSSLPKTCRFGARQAKTWLFRGLSEQRDAPFSYHGNLCEKFLKFRQGNFSSRCDFVIAWLTIPQGSSVLPHSSASKVGSRR